MKLTINGKDFRISMLALSQLNTVLADAEQVMPTKDNYDRKTDTYHSKDWPDGPRRIMAITTAEWV